MLVEHWTTEGYKLVAQGMRLFQPPLHPCIVQMTDCDQMVSLSYVLHRGHTELVAFFMDI